MKKIYLEITKLDEEQRMVFGYASTQALDSQGEVIKREAVEAALPDYMRFANIREMHQPSAVGVTKEADMDHKGLHIAAKVVDDEAWEKVKEGVYKGFSIGGRVTKRDPDNRKIITGLELNEISLVDRPANPDAIIDLHKLNNKLAKEGRRNSKADQERIQHVHDTAVALGASCPGAQDQPDQAIQDGVEDGPDDGDDDGSGVGAGDTGDDSGDGQDKAAATGDLAKLAKFADLAGKIEKLTRIVEEQGALLKKISSQPAPPKYQSTSRAVEKGHDGLAKRGEEEQPKTALEAIRKAHQNPIRARFF